MMAGYSTEDSTLKAEDRLRAPEHIVGSHLFGDGDAVRQRLAVLGKVEVPEVGAAAPGFPKVLARGARAVLPVALLYPLVQGQTHHVIAKLLQPVPLAGLEELVGDGKDHALEVGAQASAELVPPCAGIRDPRDHHITVGVLAADLEDLLAEHLEEVVHGVRRKGDARLRGFCQSLKLLHSGRQLRRSRGLPLLALLGRRPLRLLQVRTPPGPGVDVEMQEATPGLEELSEGGLAAAGLAGNEDEAGLVGE
mmetsp:Transcript_56682/g.143570  ORF Transcript_56682/g.143570 Transcript_56682/m.143570 type:complete len:251 (-) Transcript_56682:62-814(-)